MTGSGSERDNQVFVSSSNKYSMLFRLRMGIYAKENS